MQDKQRSAPALQNQDVPPAKGKTKRAPSDQELTMEDQALRCLQNKRPTFTLGSVGPYDIQVNSLNTLMTDNQVSDEVMNSICDILSKVRPHVLHINCQALTKILNGSKRAKSIYFLKNNVLERPKEVFGVYLENGNHWTFFESNLFKDKTYSYADSILFLPKTFTYYPLKDRSFESICNVQHNLFI